MEGVRTNNVFHVSFRLLGIVTMGLPAFGTAFAIMWSFMYDFKGSTATHCGVYNFLPSISAAIGRAPQRYVWRICIALHAAPRFMIALAYLGWHKKIYVGKGQKSYLVGAHLAVFLHLVENSMLVLLTSVSSNENNSKEQKTYLVATHMVVALNIVENITLVIITSVSSTDCNTIHEGSFIMFIASSWSYMLLTIFLVRWRLGEQSWRKEKKDLMSYTLKKTFAVMNILGFLMATYLYFRHNWYCEPKVYSYFAFFEYVTIFTNIAYHGTAILDLRDYSVGVVLTDLLVKHR